MNLLINFFDIRWVFRTLKLCKDSGRKVTSIRWTDESWAIGLEPIILSKPLEDKVIKEIKE